MNDFYTTVNNQLKSAFCGWIKWDWLFYLTCLFVLILSTIILNGSRLSLLIACCSITGAVFNAKLFRVCFVFYLISTVLYAFVAYQNRFYGEFFLDVFYLFPVYIYGLFFWRRNAPQRGKTGIANLKTKQLILIVFIGIILILFYGYILLILGSLLPYVNSFATFVCATAAYLAAKKIRQQWLFWILYSITVMYIWMTTLSGSTAQVPLFIVNMIFIIINIIGYRNWSKMQNIIS